MSALHNTVPATVRIARDDAVVLGHKLDAGSRLVLLTCNMARDKSLFPDPDRLDITRIHDTQARRLWYGAGPHYCAGFHLAQCELAAVLQILVEFGNDLRIIKRRAAFGRLLPSYASLLVQSANRAG